MSSAQLKKFDLVRPADIEWRNNLPYSLEFNDIYYSDSGALAESEHVFLKGCQLESDWKNSSQTVFYLAELGFGSGLNFLNTAELWHKKINLLADFTHKKLHYISIEKRPFLIEDITRSCQSWPQFHHISDQLIRQYPSTSYGRFQLNFELLNITLTLLFMPADNALQDLIDESESQQNKIKIDHWFLDGFAPNKNDSMWAQQVTNQIARLSRIGTRLATYSVASVVKKPIIEAGFKITKQKGFGRKREMLTAKFEKPFNPTQSKYINIKFERPWFKQSRSEKTEIVAVIGGGIAGCATAYNLYQKGFSIDLFEAQSSLASGASGAAAGIFHPQLTSDLNINSQFSWQAYLYLLNFLSSLTPQEKESVILTSGVIRFLSSQKAKQQLLQLSDSLHLGHWLKDETHFSGVLNAVTFPDAAALDMTAFCKLLFSKCAPEKKSLNLNCKISNLEYADGYWTFRDNFNKTYRYNQVVYCGGAKSNLLDQLVHWPTKISRGQTCFVDLKQSLQLGATALDKTLCGKVYLVPRPNNRFHLGSTFEDFNDDQLNINSQKEILSKTRSMLEHLAPDLITPALIDNQQLAGTLGYRLHSSDRLPFIGGAIDNKKLIQDFTNIGQKPLLRESISHYNLAGLWLNTGYGSHGLLYALLAGQHLASLINNDISPLSTSLAQSLNPVRFPLRSLRAAIQD